MDIEKIVNFAEKNKGLIKTSELKKLGADYRGIQKLIEKEILEKIRNGTYKLKDYDLTEEELVCSLFPNGVLCMESALFIHGYLESKPFQWDIAVNKDVSKSLFKIDYPFVKPYYMEEDQLMVGAVKYKMFSGEMFVYDKERTIVDCIKYENKTNRDIYTKAVRSYIDDPDKNQDSLYSYAATRRIYRKVKDVLGIWI